MNPAETEVRIGCQSFGGKAGQTFDPSRDEVGAEGWLGGSCMKADRQGTEDGILAFLGVLLYLSASIGARRERARRVRAVRQPVERTPMM